MSAESVTQALRNVRDRQPAAVDQLFPVIYDELRALARRYRTRERPGVALQTTALVHEAYLKLVNQREADWRDRAHFFAVAAQAIRRILVDQARTARRAKRGGGVATLPLDESVPGELKDSGVDVIALDEALEGLRTLHERQARVVELRYFAGLRLDEVAEALGVAPSTVDGDWAMARAWLRRALRDEQKSD
jgi:RNA polymerase sigma factor (TIGR02999 family)